MATSGGLSALTLRALRAIETACGAERDELVACVLDAVMRANASIVQSARYRSNLAVRSARTARGCCVFSKDGIVAHSQVTFLMIVLISLHKHLGSDHDKSVCLYRTSGSTQKNCI